MSQEFQQFPRLDLLAIHAEGYHFKWFKHIDNLSYSPPFDY